MTKYIEHVLKNVICSSFSTLGSGQGGKPTENITLDISAVGFNQFLKDEANRERAVRGGHDFTNAAKV